MAHITLTTPDMGCEHCVAKIKKALAGLAVTNVQVDLPTKQVTFDYPNDQVLAQVKEVLADIGYPVAA
ncbi:MAG: heavy-metal-associated domain-containing protein [Anaerolineae bacterium]